jgi:GT2 family glycosyltransferase
MSAAPRVSVIVPLHSGAELLRTCLRTILRQTYRDIEVVVAGDGAGEEVRREAFSTGDPRVRWEEFPKAPGLGYSNRARAIAKANGRLIAYLAPDDLWAADHLERLVAALDRDRLDLVFSRPVLVWADGIPRPHYLPFDLARGGLAPPQHLLACLSPSQTIHTREIHDRAGGWTDRFVRHGDVDLWLRCRTAGARIGYVREATVIRFPSYAFRAQADGSLAALHARLAERLASGELAPRNLRWPLHRKILGWIEDVFVAGPARGPGWAKALLRRAWGVRVTLNKSEPKP